MNADADQLGEPAADDKRAETRQQAKPKRKRGPRRKPGEPPRPRGRRPKDGLPPKQRADRERQNREESTPPPPPATPEELWERVSDLAGIGLPLADIAAAVDVAIEDLQDGGRPLDEVFEEMLRRRRQPVRLSAAVKKGISWKNEQVARPGFEAAKAKKGSPIPRIFWNKCRMAWRETGERETEAKKERKIGKVIFTLIKGGLDAGKESAKSGNESGESAGRDDTGPGAPGPGVRGEPPGGGGAGR